MAQQRSWLQIVDQQQRTIKKYVGGGGEEVHQKITKNCRRGTWGEGGTSKDYSLQNKLDFQGEIDICFWFVSFWLYPFFKNAVSRWQVGGVGSHPKIVLE